jgi:predicted alpha/beta-fold hydrolase
MIESQYIDAYLDATADPDTRWTPNTFLSYTLHGKAKDYSGHYYRALMRAIDRRVTAGTVTMVRSKGGSQAYMRAADASTEDTLWSMS